MMNTQKFTPTAQPGVSIYIPVPSAQYFPKIVRQALPINRSNAWRTKWIKALQDLKTI